MRFTPFFCFVAWLAAHNLAAQSLQLGGLQGSQTLVLTPSPAENQKIKGQNPFDIAFLGLSIREDEKVPFAFAPKLPKDWPWVAVFNMPLPQAGKNKKVSFFYYDSWVGTSVRCKTSGRHRNFPEDVSGLIKSNAYHIALHRTFQVENETFLLLVSPIKQKVVVELPDSIYKTHRRLEYAMEANEAKFVHIIVPPDEYSVVTWQAQTQFRQERLLKEGWKFHLGDVKGAEKPSFDDREWQSVSVPHTWNGMQQFDLRNYHDTLDITEMYRRDIGWYRCQFQVPPHWKDQYIKVDFLAANQTADVWLNGRYLGQHKGGYTGFHFGLSEALHLEGPNVLAVKVDNRFDVDIPPHTADYNFQGGLYREVRLMAWPKAFVKALEIQTPKVHFQEAEVLVNTILKNGGQTGQKFTLITSIVNPYQEIIQSQITETEIAAGQKITLRQAFQPVKHPQLWSPENPAFYQVLATLYNAQGQVIDQTQDNFGFRSLEFTADRGFLLNGERVKLKGVNVHQDLYGVGWAMDSTQKRKDYLMIKAMGANFVRMSHYPHHPYELYLCDSLGLMVYPEIPVVNTVGEEKFVAQAVAMMEDMVMRDRNHPSIIMWGVGNEYYRETFTEEVAEWALRCTEAVAQKAKALDPYRPTIQAQNDLKDERIMPLTDIQGRNRYFGWYTGADVYAGINHFDGFGEMMTQEHQKHPQWKILVTEYGAEGKYGYHVNQPKRFDHSETYQLLFHKAYWHYIAQHDWVLGGTIWNMFDFTSFAKVGNIPHINQKGTATFDRKPKSLYYFYQSQWSQHPMVYIYSHTWTHRTAPPGVPQSLEVFSNCDMVELWLNGHSLGKHLASEGWVWPATLKVGLNRALAIGYHRGEVVKNELSFYFYPAKEGPRQISGTDAD